MKVTVRYFVISLVLAVLMVGISACTQEEKPQVSGTAVNSVASAVQDKSAEQARQREEHEAELKQPFWALIMGGDTRANTTEGWPEEYGTYELGYSDTMMLAKVWPEENRITLLTIPRDSQVWVDGESLKINDVLKWQGIDASVAKVESVAGIDIKYYFATDFARFVEAVDLIGGVDIVSPIDMHYTGIVKDTTSYDLVQGENHLDGEGALGFARARKVYATDLEACRQIQDRQIIQRIIEAGVASPKEMQSIYSAAVEKFVDTNMAIEDLNFYIDYFSQKDEGISFYSGTSPYDGYIMEDSQKWMIPYDEAVWQELIAKIEEGGDPCEVVPLPDVQPK